MWTVPAADIICNGPGPPACAPGRRQRNAFMIRIEECKLDLNYTENELTERVCSILRVKRDELLSLEVVRRAVDARNKRAICYVLTIDVQIRHEKKVLQRAGRPNLKHIEPLRYHFPKCSAPHLSFRPVIVGSGPCGLFCAYELALHGFRPVLLERGSAVETRAEKMRQFFADGLLDPANNAQFGEGGAGTFSDGKLTTSIHDPAGRIREVLRIFVEMGADSSILFDARPHLGTDVLIRILQNFRKRILELGGSIRFDSCVTDISVKENHLTGVTVNERTSLETEAAVFAIGHSARDTIRLLRDKEVRMEPKPFAVGFRIEHPQEMIDLSQYGFTDHTVLGAAPYRVHAGAPDGRGVYSFCMCPGGYVINASSEPEKLCVNGMSYSGRDAKNANSAIVVSVLPQDTATDGALSFLSFQEALEKKAYQLAGGAIPQQLYGDFCNRKTSLSYGDFESTTKGAHAFSNLRELLPPALTDAFLYGMERFGRQIDGFDRADAILSGVESRTSSPVRIPRDENGVSSVEGLYPAGEGAGYAGGIVSAAVDGIRTAEHLAMHLTGMT